MQKIFAFCGLEQENYIPTEKATPFLDTISLADSLPGKQQPLQRFIDIWQPYVTYLKGLDLIFS